MASIRADGPILRIATDHYQAAVTTEGYTSGVLAGSFTDRASGARELGFGLLIADFLLEPGHESVQTPEPLRYPIGDACHGHLAKRYVALPQICTQARRLPCQVVLGEDFVAVRQWFNWPIARPPYQPGSRWEQWLVFPDGVPWFFGYDRITSANEVDTLHFRGDVPGHLRHDRGDTFRQIYLSYEGLLPAEAFLDDFPPDAAHLYQRDDAAVPQRLIRAYQTATGPWLASLALDPSTVYQAWCHQRGYVCFINELGGRPVRAGESFGAVHLVGWFDELEAMEATYDRYAGATGLRVSRRGWSLT